MDNHVDSATGTVLLKARYANADGALWPGEFVDVTLVLEVQPDATVIPGQAVLTGQQVRLLKDLLALKILLSSFTPHFLCFIRFAYLKYLHTLISWYINAVITVHIQVIDR